jgi:hypothetical protein
MANDAKITQLQIRVSKREKSAIQGAAKRAGFCYIAAMVEYACGRRATVPPAWTRSIVPLADPIFASSLKSLRLQLLIHSPAPFRRRNIFIDSSLGTRI